jgi:tripartite-type tricarboxylate transporter receptor subunit TctC
VPTVAEAGVPGYESTLWFGLLTSAAVPRPIIEKISADAGKVLASPATRERWAPIGIEPRPTTPAQFDERVAGDTRVFTEIARAANIRAE